MKFLLIIPCFLLTGCSSILPQVLNTVDDIETDEVVEIKVYRDALQRDTDLKINLDLNNQKIPMPA